MNLVISPGQIEKSHRIRWRRFLSLGLLLVVPALVLGGYGFYEGFNRGQQSVVSQWREDIVLQELRIQSARDEAQARLNVLGQEMGRLQAQVNRIDALGTRLVMMASLDKGEFDFSSVPGVGGADEMGEQGDSVTGDIAVAMSTMQKQLDGRQDQLRVLDDLLLSRELSREILPSGSPIRSGWLSSGYGRRNDPFTGKKTFHKGLDFAGKQGSDVIAVAGGVVSIAEKRGDYGYLIEIDHGGRYATRYGHNDKLYVSVGEAVHKGQVIAAIGSSGRSTGPHVHFEVWKDGKRVNPGRFVQASR
ncbi:MAG: M23 family metallopeptidase [Gammaproteobacteria bacterium]|jgi:murein DD-endopeptidase MepM/ murein hydrolase activator NlpD|nr:M23 family metallopeptidase [Gammaproteobacteria bacterium]